MKVTFFLFSELKRKRDAYIKRLNGIYAKNLEKVEILKTWFGHTSLHTPRGGWGKEPANSCELLYLKWAGGEAHPLVPLQDLHPCHT